MAITKFGEWTPDQPDYENPGGMIDVTNVVPGSGGYRPFLGPTVVSATTISATALGVYSFIDDANDTRQYVGTTAKLWSLEGTAHANYTRSTTAYSVVEGDYWNFEKFDKNVYAVNGNDYLQTIEIGNNTFQDITAAPIARHLCVIKDHLMLGSLGTERTTVHWPAIGDPQTWPALGTATADAVQTGRQTINTDGGPIQGMVGGEIGFIFQEQAITRATYVGGSLTFQFDNVTKGLGLAGPKAWVKVGGIVYFLSHKGFYTFDGSTPLPIGEEKVDNTFFSTISRDLLYKVQATNNPANNTVIWNFPVAGATPQQYIYNYVTGKWGKAEHDVDWLFFNFGRGATIDEMDTHSAGAATIDALTVPVDSPEWYNRGAVLSGYNSSFQLTDYTGTALTATFVCAETANPDGRRTYIDNVRPLIEASATMVQVGTRDTANATESFTSSSTVQSVGVAFFTSEGVYHRPKFTVKDLTLAIGYQLNSPFNG